MAQNKPEMTALSVCIYT